MLINFGVMMVQCIRRNMQKEWSDLSLPLSRKNEFRKVVSNFLCGVDFSAPTAGQY